MRIILIGFMLFWAKNILAQDVFNWDEIKYNVDLSHIVNIRPQHKKIDFKNISIISNGNMVATIGSYKYYSTDKGLNWKVILGYDKFFHTKDFFIGIKGGSGDFFDLVKTAEKIEISYDGKNWEKNGEFNLSDYFPSPEPDGKLFKLTNPLLYKEIIQNERLNFNNSGYHHGYLEVQTTYNLYNSTVDVDTVRSEWYYEYAKGNFTRDVRNDAKYNHMHFEYIYSPCYGQYYTFSNNKLFFSSDRNIFTIIGEEKVSHSKRVTICNLVTEYYEEQFGYKKFADKNYNYANKKFKGLSYNPNDKRMYAIDYHNNGLLLKSKNEISCGCADLQTVPNSSITFGTTVITHGYQLGGTPPTSQSDWTFQMAIEIIKKAGKGTIRTYDKSTGEFKTNTTVGVGGETVLLFDWAAESDDNQHGYSEAAGDALFTALMMEKKKGNTTLENLHFIGHSRGCIVNTECAERLLAIKKNIDHITNIDPHDWGGAGSNIATDWDNHPNLNIPFPNDRKLNNGVVSWKGVEFVDSYWQSNLAITLNILDGRPVDGAKNYDWNAYSNGHTDIHETYKKSINSNYPNSTDCGYCYSRLGVNKNNRPSPNSPHPEKYTPSFDFFNPMTYGSNSIRIRGIMNGGFDRGGVFSPSAIPGWHFHGGEISGESSIRLKDGYAELNDSPNSITTTRTILRHNRFFVPEGANSIAFKYKSLKPEKGKLNIKIQSQTSTKSREFSINLEKVNSTFLEHSVDVGEFSQDVIVLEFELVNSGKDLLTVALDDIRFDKNKPTLSATATPQTSNQTQTVQQPTAIKEEFKSLPTKIENSDFSNSSGWKTLEGDAEFKNGFVTLNPKKNKAVMSFESSNFQIPEHVQTLSIRADKSEIGKGDFKVYLVTEGVEEIVHTEKIDNSLNKAIKIISDTDKALETGNLPEKKTSRNFEQINIDISKYKGKAAKIKVAYESKGMIKAKLYLDEVTLK